MRKSLAVFLSMMVWLLSLTIMTTVSFAATEGSGTADVYRAYFVYTDKGVSSYEVEGDGLDNKSDILIATTDPDVIAAQRAINPSFNAASTGNGFVLDGTTVAITSATSGHECHYFFEGDCTNGNIYVAKNASDDIELELQGLNLAEPNMGSCPLEIGGGTTRVTLKAKKDTKNSFTDAQHLDGDGEAVAPKACIKSSKKLEIGGKGSLTVNANNKDGIKSDTKVEISSKINLTVNSAGSAISADKEILLASDYEGILNVNSQGKGLCGSFDKEDLDEGDSWEEYDNVIIEGGTVNITSKDDAIHSNRAVSIIGGTCTLQSEDDAIHGDDYVAVGTEGSTGGLVVKVPSCFEGIESHIIDVFSGDIDITAADDGINASNMETKEAIPDKRERKRAPADESCNVNIHGGDIYIMAGKDAVDSNGKITITGGNCVLFASTGKATKTSDALDAGCEITFEDNDGSGGTVFGASPTGSKQTVPRCDGQNYEMGTLECDAADEITVEDGNTTKTYTMGCSDGFIIYTSPTYDGGSITNTRTTAVLSPKLTTKHTIEKVEASAATCTSKGCREHWKCTVCGALFADQEGKTEISLSDLEIKPLGHNHAIVKRAKATSSKNGYEIYKCSRCGDSYKKEYSKSYVRNFKLKKQKAAFTARWTKRSKTVRKHFSKYQLRYSTDKGMSNAVTKNISKKKSSIKISGLSHNAKYYVQIRTYSRGCWSKWTTKAVTTK